MYNNLIPQTDNFFKYILTMGIVLMIFTIIYPIQKEKEYDLEYLKYIGEKNLIDFKIKSLELKTTNLIKIQKYTQSEVDSLKTLMGSGNLKQDKYISSLRIEKKNDFDSLKATLLNIIDSLKINEINLSNQKSKIEQVEKYVITFSLFKIVLLPVSFLLIIIGFRYWISSVYLEELKKCKEYQPEYRSSFIRHCDFLLNIFIKRNS